MATTKEYSVEEKLKALIKVQKIESKLDQIQILKGELPMEVKDLEDEIEGLNARKNRIEEEINGIQEFIESRKEAIKDAQALEKKYEKQSENVKNNREFEAINKELEMQGLEIKLAEKHIKEMKASIEHKKDIIKPIRAVIESSKPEAVIAGLRALANRSEMCQSLNSIEIPTLIICGKEDVVTPVEQAELMLKNIKNAKLHIISKAAHLTNLEQPLQFNKIIAEFIANLPHLSAMKLYGNENRIAIPILENEING